MVCVISLECKDPAILLAGEARREPKGDGQRLDFEPFGPSAPSFENMHQNTTANVIPLGLSHIHANLCTEKRINFPSDLMMLSVFKLF